MNDLFSSETELERLPIPDAEVYYLSKLQLDSEPMDILSRLTSNIPWREEKITVWGKTHIQPRLIAWYGDDGLDYTYSGIHLNPLPWNADLLDLKKNVEKVTSTEFNSVLLNFYRNNRDSMGFHSDDEPELGVTPIIASISLGTVRTLVFKHKFRKELKPIKLPLASGSLLLMKGDTQRNWKHGIEKESAVCDARINLTFRKIFL
ncbi:alpha-ketoglutarate-dependent dioxygenase AlkB family protein [Undibacterium sp. JH2W]|uniref:alpha-ketoglutarate-dependent dioxygenase AlkB family protein n=1 Tax=Undibacterium sp. JH2W TaxID=3413037 RepID=UPI003BF0F79B